MLFYVLLEYKHDKFWRKETYLILLLLLFYFWDLLLFKIIFFSNAEVYATNFNKWLVNVNKWWFNNRFPIPILLFYYFSIFATTEEVWFTRRWFRYFLSKFDASIFSCRIFLYQCFWKRLSYLSFAQSLVVFNFNIWDIFRLEYF